MPWNFVHIIAYDWISLHLIAGITYPPVSPSVFQSSLCGVKEGASKSGMLGFDVSRVSDLQGVLSRQGMEGLSESLAV